MKTPFEAGKTAQELGIDTSRKFVVVNDGWAQPHPYAGHNTFRNGDLLAFLYWFSIDEGTARFKRDSDGAEDCCLWSRLAYADDVAEPVRVEEAYEPRVGDRVSLEGDVVEIEEGRRVIVKLQPDAGEIYVYPKDVENGVLKLLSRKTRTLTKAEAETLLTEKLGESVRIEN